MLITSNTATLLSVLFLFTLGSFIGSFLNAMIYRIPRGISIIFPRSSCPNCGKKIPTFALIPILGYLLSRRKCILCAWPIPISYLFVEVLAGLGTCLIFSKYYFFAEIFFFHQNFLLEMRFLELVSFLWVFYTAIVLCAIDIKFRILPDKITLTGIFLGFILSFLKHNFYHSFFGALLGGGGLYLISQIYRWLRKQDGMGFGDVKYLAFIGAFVGWKGVLFTLFAASCLGSVFGIFYGILTKQGLKAAIPFGPFLAIGALFFMYFWN